MEGVEKSVDTAFKEIYQAILAAVIDIERLSENDKGLPLGHRVGNGSVTLADDCLPDDPVFLLEYETEYRIRVRLLHKHMGKAMDCKITYVSALHNVGGARSLNIFETQTPSEGNEVVALFKLAEIRDSKHPMWCPHFGSIEEKYIKITVLIGIDTTVSEIRPERKKHVEMNATIWCLPVSKKGVTTSFRRWMRSASKRWMEAPQWLRDAARGAMVFTASAKTAAISGAGVVQDPSIIGCLFFDVVWNCCILPCLRTRGRSR